MRPTYGIAAPDMALSRTRRRFARLRLLFVLLLGLFVGGDAARPARPVIPAAAPAKTADARRNARVFDTVCRLVERKYYDPKLRGAQWATLTERFRREALAAPDETTLYGVINRLLGHLQDQHTFAVSPTRAREEKQGARVGLGV